ncbi:hypothetical protein BCON_0269g00040 [Botryotinia convoluta]|uniref:Cytochrome P450 n=1 Tax=Botryotinia convoluta TaxID=54673 RepID=A0A4Z1HER4_9HELO|nr:hypothetical protein BCON_0269g00040 [Botryotinia convoluta]
MSFVMLSRALTASCIGIATHSLIFIYNEWHLLAPAILSIHLLLAITVVAAEIWNGGTTYFSHLAAAISIVCYLTSLFSSIVIYRLFFHRLRHFPGPRLAAASKLWHVWQCRDSRNHLVLERLHQKYGSFVRTGENSPNFRLIRHVILIKTPSGPCEITVFTAGAFEAMDGPKSNTTRSDWYDLLHPRVSSVFTRDKELHDERRRIWSHSLSTRALSSYEPRVLRKVMGLKDHIEQANCNPIFVNDLMQWFSFDLMGDFAFSQDFGMMEKSEYHSAITMVRSAITLLGPFSPAIWIPRIGFAFLSRFWKVKDWFGMLAFCDTCMERRMKVTVKERDIASWFIEDAEKNKNNGQYRRWLSGDTATVVVAGSDTTAPTLTTLFYFLAKNPQDAEKIYQEVSNVDLQDVNAVAALHHLNGSINEAMRLLPAVLTFVTRVSPPEGMDVDGTHIPGNVKIAAPRYSIGRLSSAWKDPHKFCPERWYSRPEMILDKRAFAPFGVGMFHMILKTDGIGRTSCVGKNLALTEVRMASAHLISAFKIHFRPGDNGDAVECDLRDQLTAKPGELRLIFEPRISQ